MKLFEIHKDTYSGQCKGALLRLQVRWTAIIVLPGAIHGWAGSQVGIFAPKKYPDGYKCTGFYFHPWLAPDVAIGKLPKSYRTITRLFSFGSK